MKNLLVFVLVVSFIFVSGCDVVNNDSENSIKYEKILGLELYNFGNSMIIYSGGYNTYDLVFSNDGSYTKKPWSGNPDSSDKSVVSGTWNASGNELWMSETNGPTYTITANAEGIIKDGMSTYINGESGGVVGLFNELTGTGSGVLDMCYTDAIGKYKVELLGDVGTLVFNFNNADVNINGQLLNGGFLEDDEYEWTCNGSDVFLTKTGATGPAQDISKIDEMWWVEGSPINLYFISDASYVGYMVANIDFLGE